MLAGMVIESTYFTVVSARLSGQPVAQAMATNFAGNLATLGALKGFDKLLGVTRVGKVLGAVADGEKVGKAAYLASKGAELTGRTLVVAGVQYAQAQYESMLKHGRTLSTDELVDVGVQGMAMMIGTAVLVGSPRRHSKKSVRSGFAVGGSSGAILRPGRSQSGWPGLAPVSTRWRCCARNGHVSKISSRCGTSWRRSGPPTSISEACRSTGQGARHGGPGPPPRTRRA